MFPLPSARLPQSTELGYRFGERTRRREHRQMTAWERDEDAAASKPAEPPADGK
jgi:hypothetical protein